MAKWKPNSDACRWIADEVEEMASELSGVAKAALALRAAMYRERADALDGVPFEDTKPEEQGRLLHQMAEGHA